MILCLGEFAGQRERLKPIGSVCFPLGNLQENMSSFSLFFNSHEHIHYLPIGNFIHGSCKKITIQLQHRLQMQIVNMCTVGKKIEIHTHVCCYPNGKNWHTGTFSSQTTVYILDKQSPFVFKKQYCSQSSFEQNKLLSRNLLPKVP